MVAVGLVAVSAIVWSFFYAHSVNTNKAFLTVCIFCAFRLLNTFTVSANLTFSTVNIFSAFRLLNTHSVNTHIAFLTVSVFCTFICVCCAFSVNTHTSVCTVGILSTLGFLNTFAVNTYITFLAVGIFNAFRFFYAYAVSANLAFLTISVLCALIFINQIRDKMNVMYGEKYDTVGGKAIKFTASLRVHCKLAGKIKNTETMELDGYKARIIIDKSKVCKPFGVVNFEMLTASPIDEYSGLLDYYLRHSLVESSGTGWYNFPGGEKFRKDDFPKVYEEWTDGKDTNT